MSGLSADTWRWRFATMELMLEHLGHRVVTRRRYGWHGAGGCGDFLLA